MTYNANEELKQALEIAERNLENLLNQKILTFQQYNSIAEHLSYAKGHRHNLSEDLRVTKLRCERAEKIIEEMSEL